MTTSNARKRTRDEKLIGAHFAAVAAGRKSLQDFEKEFSRDAK